MDSHELPQAPTRLLWWAGILGAAAALAVGEVFDRLSTQTLSLVVAIGEWVIDLTPGDIVAGSINTIGTLQKPLLIVGITVVALLLGGFFNQRVKGHATKIIVFFGIFRIIGAIGGARSDLTSAGLSWLSALVAAFVGAITTVLLTRAATPQTAAADENAEFITSNADQTKPGLARLAESVEGAPVLATPGTPMSQATDRRKFLSFGGAAVGSAALLTASRVGRTGVADRARDELLSRSTTSVAPNSGTAVTTTPPSPLPSGSFDSVPGLSPRIVPISPQDEFYLIDTALQKPQVSLSEWSLSVDGFVDNESTFSYDDLASMDQIEREVTLSCVSNPVGGELVGNAMWRGVALSDVLDAAGIRDPQDMTTQIFSRSVDGWTCGFPTPLAYDGRTAMIALEMNGEPLPIIHGFPARLVIAGLYGYVSATKWLEQISITDWDDVDGFWIPRGWSKEGPVKTQSRIDVPSSGDRIAPGPTVLAGVAWSPTIGIERVEVAINDDDSWVEVELAEPGSDETWVQWKYDWDAPPGDHLVAVRATDKDGFTQSPIPVAPAPNGAEGYHVVRVRVEA